MHKEKQQKHFIKQQRLAVNSNKGSQNLLTQKSLIEIVYVKFSRYKYFFTIGF